MIRPAEITDIPVIHMLLEEYAKSGRLLARSINEITDKLPNFVVAESKGSVIGCGVLDLFGSELGEIRSLAINSGEHGKGFGKKIVVSLEENALRIGVKNMIALTYVPAFFMKQGYKTVNFSALPKEVFSVCERRLDETAMQKNLVL